MTPEERERKLSNAVHSAVIMGWRVESQTLKQVVMAGKASSWPRVILCALFWWPGFLFEHHHAPRRWTITVDEDGIVRIEKA